MNEPTHFSAEGCCLRQGQQPAALEAPGVTRQRDANGGFETTPEFMEKAP